MIELLRTNKIRLRGFHKSHGHNTEKCLHLKDAKKELIKKGMLSLYTQEDGQKEYHRRKKEYKRQDELPRKK